MDLKTLCKQVYSDTAPGIGIASRFVDYDKTVRSTLASFAGSKTSISRRWHE